VNVEPIRRQFALFETERPRDVNLNVAVGDTPGTFRFFECEDDTSLSTANPVRAEEMRKGGHVVVEYDVAVTTLRELADRHCPPTVEFLKVDVEGLEGSVLRGVDWKRFRPRALVIEATKPAVPITDWEDIDAIAKWQEWEGGLLENGYVFAYFDGLSRFYVSEEERRLGRRLLIPPGLYDDIEVAKDEVVPRLVQEKDKLTEQLSIVQSKLRAKDEVIRVQAAIETGRSVCLKGTLDLAYRWRGGPAGCGRYFPPTRPREGIHIAIDTLQIAFGVSGGVETYMTSLVSALQATDAYQITLLCLEDQLEPLRLTFGEEIGWFEFRATPSMKLAIKAASLLRRGKATASSGKPVVSFSKLYEQAGIQILHSPVQLFSSLDFGVPSVLNLHDLQHLHFPENFTPSDINARNQLYGLSTSLADAVIASSDFVRDDIVRRMGASPSKVFTVPVTWNPAVQRGAEVFTVDEARARYGLPTIYAIYPAQFWVHKNHARLVEAQKITRDQVPGIDFKLVFTGYRGHSGWPIVQRALEKFSMAEHVLCLDYVPVEHMAALYKGAVFCVMPSTFEASSYAVIEAQLLGCPTMCSNVTSLPELMRGDAGLLFDPMSPDDMAAKMIGWLKAPEDRAACAERAKLKVREEHSVAKYIGNLTRIYEYVAAKR
jgi:FkbM family methyltransferase